jgi:hypothetical protein
MAYEQKTKPGEASVTDFVESIGDDCRRIEAGRLLEILGRASGEMPRMWGTSIVGFGQYSYRYASGHGGSSFLVGFSPRRATTIYIMTSFDSDPKLMAGLGNFTTGKSCLYVKKLSDIDEAALEELAARSVARMRQLYPA